jgi:hypothetical protein
MVSARRPYKVADRGAPCAIINSGHARQVPYFDFHCSVSLKLTIITLVAASIQRILAEIQADKANVSLDSATVSTEAYRRDKRNSDHLPGG